MMTTVTSDRELCRPSPSLLWIPQKLQSKLAGCRKPVYYCQSISNNWGQKFSRICGYWLLGFVIWATQLLHLLTGHGASTSWLCCWSRQLLAGSGEARAVQMIFGIGQSMYLVQGCRPEVLAVRSQQVTHLLAQALLQAQSARPANGITRASGIKQSRICPECDKLALSWSARSPYGIQL